MSEAGAHQLDLKDPTNHGRYVVGIVVECVAVAALMLVGFAVSALGWILWR